jgi:UDP-N-acetyl-D-mannosaminuronic acid transferase (WecB/TagA/CpsF family)
MTVVSLEQAVDYLIDLGLQPAMRGVAVHFAPVYSVALAEVDPMFRSTLLRGDLIFSDGMAVVWAGRWLYPADADLWMRVYGPDVMAGVLRASRAEGPGHYLLGGSQATLQALVQRIEHEWPQARIVGAESPPSESQRLPNWRSETSGFADREHPWSGWALERPSRTTKCVDSPMPCR